MSTESTTRPSPRRRHRSTQGPAGSGRGRPAIAAAPPAWRSPFVIVTAVAVIVMVAFVGVLYVTGNTSGGPSGDTLGIVRPPDSNLALYEDGEALGPADAPVVLEVFSDYQCPVCGKFGRDYVPRLASTFVADGSLRIVERSIVILDAPGSTESLDAASGAACAAREGSHWEYHDYLMWNQAGENDGAFSRARLAAIAERVGLDRDAFTSCLTDSTVRAEVVERTEAALAAGINRTPTLVVNGEAVVGLVAYDDLVAMIERELEAAAGS